MALWLFSLVDGSSNTVLKWSRFLLCKLFIILCLVSLTWIFLKGGRVQGQKLLELDSEITGDPKGLLRVLRSQTLRYRSGGHALFPASITLISNQQSIDISFLSFHEIFQPNWPKNGRVMAKKNMPIYGIICTFREFLSHNLAKSWYVSMRPSLFDYCYQITFYPKVLTWYLKKCGFYIQKTPKNSQNQPYLRLHLLPNRSH